MSAATGEKTMEWENQIMQAITDEGEGGCDGDELAAARTELMSLNICAICWGSPHNKPCGFCGTVAKPHAFSGVGAIWVISWCVSQWWCEHPCRLSQGPEGAGWVHTEGGVDGGWTLNYLWQPSPWKHRTHGSLQSCWSELDTRTMARWHPGSPGLTGGPGWGQQLSVTSHWETCTEHRWWRIAGIWECYCSSMLLSALHCCLHGNWRWNSDRPLIWHKR